MTENSSQTLTHFFAIKPNTINWDLKQADKDIATICDEILSLSNISDETMTPETRARIAHLGLIHASHFQKHSTEEPEIKINVARIAAYEILHCALTIAAANEGLLEIKNQILADQKRACLPMDSYQIAEPVSQVSDEDAQKYGKWSERITDTVLPPPILRKYQMNHLAEQLEADTDEFRIQCEIRRRMNDTRPQVAKITKYMDQLLEKNCGIQSVPKVYQRVAEAKAARLSRATQH